MLSECSLSMMAGGGGAGRASEEEQLALDGHARRRRSLDRASECNTYVTGSCLNVALMSQVPPCLSVALMSQSFTLMSHVPP